MSAAGERAKRAGTRKADGNGSGVKIRRWRGERRTEFLKVMLTADEKRALIEHAHGRGSDVSTWVREQALRAAGYKAPVEK